MDLQFRKTGLSNIPDLEPGVVHIWALNLQEEERILSLFKEALSKEELDRVSFFEFEAKKKSYVFSQGGLRFLLSKYTKVPPQEIHIGRSRKGKPYVVEDRGIYFNITNSANLVLIAFTLVGELGVDIEKVRSLPDLDELIESNFFEEEQRYICSDPDRKATRFFRLWTVKESYLKAIGEGMRLPPHLLKLDIQTDTTKGISVDGFYDPVEWKFHEFVPAANYVATLTCSSKVKLIESFTFRG